MAASNDPSPPQSDHAADPELERTLLSPGVGRSDAPKLVIEVLSGGRRGLVKECFEEDLSLGRRPGNTLSFDGREDRAVSASTCACSYTKAPGGPRISAPPMEPC